MGKRISRRELKEKIRDLSFKLRTEQQKYATLHMEHKVLQKRFMDLGSKAESYDVKGAGIHCIEIKPEPVGTYACMEQDMEESLNLVELISERLAYDIAKGLIKSNAIQIIKNDDVIFGNTIGAKLWVIPWDKMVKKIVIMDRSNAKPR